MDWFTILIVLLFVVFPLIQQMLEARNRGNAPAPPEEMEGHSDGYPDGEVRSGDEPMGLPEGWSWEWEPDGTESREQRHEVPQPERRPSAPEPVVTPRLPERPRAPSHTRMPEHAPRPHAEPSQARFPDHIPRPQPGTGQAGRMPEHVPRPQPPARRSAEPERAPIAVSVESLRPVWEERRERRAPQVTAAKQRPAVAARQRAGLPQQLRDRNELRRAILLSEVLAEPRAIRPHGDPMPPWGE
jgi:hypothetical protein